MFYYFERIKLKLPCTLFILGNMFENMSNSLSNKLISLAKDSNKPPSWVHFTITEILQIFPLQKQTLQIITTIFCV